MRTPRTITETHPLAALLFASGEGAPNLEDKLRLLESFRAQANGNGKDADRLLLAENERLRSALADVSNSQEELRKVVDVLTAPPVFPAMYLGSTMDTGVLEVLVFQGGNRRQVRCLDGVELDGLDTGDTVVLNNTLNAVIGRSHFEVDHSGETAIFDRYVGETRAVVKQRDEEIMVRLLGEAARTQLKKDDHLVVSREAWVAYRVLPRSKGEHLFLDECPKATWADIGGLDRQIAEMQRSIQLRVFHPEIARRYGLPPLRSILLTGPPGTGKTMLAGALANWLGEISGHKQARFINVKPSGLHSVWYSKSEANYREVFRVAREAGAQDPAIPVVIFFDEVDSIGATRGQSLHTVDDRVIQAFAAELDGLSDRGNIMVVGSTNRRDAIDPALLRPGRFGDCVIHVPRPNMKAAREIFSKCLRDNLPYEGQVHGADSSSARSEIIESAVSHLYSPNGESEIAEVMLRDGKRQTVKARDLMSGASIAKICRVAIERACVRELHGGGSGIRLEDFLEGIGCELETLASALTPINCRNHIEGLPQDVDVVKVEPVRRKPPNPHHYLNHA